MNKSCNDCVWFDREHAQMYEEFICTKADMIIRLKKGQHRPSDCPLDKERWTLVGENENAVLYVKQT